VRVTSGPAGRAGVGREGPAAVAGERPRAPGEDRPVEPVRTPARHRRGPPAWASSATPPKDL